MKFKTQEEKDAKQLLDSVLSGNVKRNHRDVFAAEALLGLYLVSKEVPNPADPKNPREIHKIVRRVKSKMR